MPRPSRVPMVAGAWAFVIAVLATSNTNVALPSIRADLASGVSGLQWTVNGYALLLTSLLLSMGVLCDQRGARRVMLAGLGLFGAGAALAAAAPSLTLLVAAQVLKGAGGAALIPAGLAVVAHAYSEPRAQARAVAAISGASGVAVAAGPVVSGLLIGAFSWRAVFLIDVAGAAALALLAWRRLEETPHGGARNLDIPGQLLAVTALAALTYGVVNIGVSGWTSLGTLGPIGLALLAGLTFLAVERRTLEPMLPLSLMRERGWAVPTVCCLLVNFAFYGQIFVLSLYLQEHRGLSAFATGLMFVALSGPAALAALPAGRLTGSGGARMPGAVGALIAAAAMLVLALASSDSPLLVVVAGLALMGIGPGLAVPSLTAAMVAGAPRGQTGIASAAFTTGRQLGGLLGVAVLGTLVASGDFVDRMHITLLISAGVFLVTAIAAVTFVLPRPVRAAPEASGTV